MRLMSMEEEEYIQHCRKQYNATVARRAEGEEERFRSAARAMSISVIGLNYGPWLRECMSSRDWAGLNDLVFQRMRYALVPGLPAGTDHCALCLPALAALACGEWEAVENIFPRELGLTRNGHPFDVVMSNLLLSLWYREEGWMAEALAAGERFCSQKRPRWQRAAVGFLMALRGGDGPEMTRCLQELCKGFMRSDYSSEEKELCVPAHGLYCLAGRIAEGKGGCMPSRPAYRNFSQEYALWRMENPAPACKLYFAYPPPMEIWNQVLLAPVAQSRLRQPLSAKGKKTQILDEEGMLDSFCQNRMRK